MRLSMHSKRLNKKGASGPPSAGPVAVLIFIIALFMAIYILLLPQDDRDQLLNQNLTDDNDVAERFGESLFLLEPKTTGIIKPFSSDKEVHDIDSVNLFIKEEPEVELLANSLFVTRTIFSDNSKKLSFRSDDLELLDKVTLFFNVFESEGRLIILVNNVEIFNEPASGQQSVTIPLISLERLNVIEFKASSPGAVIWSSNKYRLSDIRLKQNFKLENTKESRTFVLTEAEAKENAKLSFEVYCNNPSTSRASRLKILINNKQIEEEVIECTSVTKNIDVDSEDLTEGKNILMFEVTKGDLLINNIELETKVKEGGALKYDFTVTEEDFDDILSDIVEAEIRFDFSSEDRKRATIDINGNKFTLDTKDLSFSKTVSSFIREGNNFLRITPLNEFEVDNLEIRLIE